MQRRSRIPDLCLVSPRPPEAALLQAAPPPGGAAGEAQALLVTWETAWRAAATNAAAAGAPPPSVAPLLRALFAAPLLAAAIGAAAHAAAALVAPMLLREMLRRLEDESSRGSDWRLMAGALIGTALGGELFLRGGVCAAASAGLRMRACVHQAVFRRLLLDASLPLPLVPAPPAAQQAVPPPPALRLLAEDARTFAGACAASHAAALHALSQCHRIAECVPAALQAWLTPASVAACAALLFYVLGGPGLVGVAVCAAALALASALSPRSSSLAVLAAAGPLGAAAAFAVHAHQGHVLNAGDAFATLWLLDVLRAALAAAPAGGRALVRVAAADVRLSAALAPRVVPPASPEALLGGAPPALRAALATPGALIMLAGPPGAGKSALCRATASAAAAALAANSAAGGGPAARPRFALAGSTPFLLARASVRDNILFGSPYDAARYVAACDATALRRAVLPLLPAGDLSRPGDAPLPPYARQLICLARACYAQLPAAALDCRLSELDAPTAAAVFRDALGPAGALASATRALVLDAGSLHLLAEADCGVLVRGAPHAGRLAAAGPHAVLRAHPQLAELFSGGGSARRRDALEAATAAGAPRAAAVAAADSASQRRVARRSESWCPGASPPPQQLDEPLHTARAAAPAAAALASARASFGTPAPKAQLAARRVARSLLCALAAALLLASQFALSVATWRLTEHLDGAALPLAEALLFLAVATLVGAALLAAGMAAAARASAASQVAEADEVAPGCEAATQRRASTAAAMFAVAVGVTSAALLASIAPQSLAATLPAAALALRAASTSRPRRRAAARRAVASSRTISALMTDMEPPDAAATVAAYGAAQRFGADLARLLDALNGEEWCLARSSTAAGAMLDAAAVGALAAALTAPGPRGRGAAGVGWAVLQARWAAAALRAASALAHATPPRADEGNSE